MLFIENVLIHIRNVERLGRPYHSDWNSSCINPVSDEFPSQFNRRLFTGCTMSNILLYLCRPQDNIIGFCLCHSDVKHIL